MAGFEDIIAAISTDVVSSLATAGYPALTTALGASAGAILVGRQAQADETAPPRILFVPMQSSFGAKDIYNQSPAAGLRSASHRLQTQQRAILSERITFEVRCWGVAGGGYATDFGATWALYRQVIASTWLVCGPFTTNGISAENGTWVDSNYGESQFVVRGREFVFGLTFPMPVLDSIQAATATVPIRPAGTTTASTGVTMTNPSGSTGTETV